MLNTWQDWWSFSSHHPWLVAIALNSVLAIVATIIPKKLLTPAGLINAWGLGVVIWGTLGWRGYGVVLFYFSGGFGSDSDWDGSKRSRGDC